MGIHPTAGVSRATGRAVQALAGVAVALTMVRLVAARPDTASRSSTP